MQIDLSKIEYRGIGTSPLKQKVFENTPLNGTIIDIGCKQGWWMQVMARYIPPELLHSVYKIGADPIDYQDRERNASYNLYVKAAIGIEDDSEVEFYTLNEPGCNSLLEPSKERLNTWYSGQKRQINSIIYVKQRRMGSILDDLDSGISESVYYLKTDCQGADLDAIKSMGQYLEKTEYVEMELSLDREKPFYKHCDTVMETLEFFDNLGFYPIEFSSFPISPLPEGELFFKRKR